ncbi:MAG: hypothetical protein U1F43_14830 [Myxococcota bacterium]
MLTQTVAAGIGNVYKSEVLFLERLHWTAVHAVGDDDLRRVYRRARELMQPEPRRRRLAHHDAAAGVGRLARDSATGSTAARTARAACAARWSSRASRAPWRA